MGKRRVNMKESVKNESSALDINASLIAEDAVDIYQAIVDSGLYREYGDRYRHLGISGVSALSGDFSRLIKKITFRSTKIDEVELAIEFGIGAAIRRSSIEIGKDDLDNDLSEIYSDQFVAGYRGLYPGCTYEDEDEKMGAAKRLALLDRNIAKTFLYPEDADSRESVISAICSMMSPVSDIDR